LREVLYFRLLSFLKRIGRRLVADFTIDKALLIRLCIALRLRAFISKSSNSSSSPTASPAAYVIIPLQSSRGIIIAAVEVVLVVVLAYIYIELRRGCCERGLNARPKTLK